MEPQPNGLNTFSADDQVQAASTVVKLKDGRPTDLWSTAYREAVDSSSDKVKSIIMNGEKIEDLLTRLEETNENIADNSLFWRGVKRLQEPLRFFKLAVDMAKPFASIEPTASTAVGAIAITACGAEEKLKSQIVRMLEHVAIIDDCDILGQKISAENDIQMALVPVYKDLLNFYISALDILNSKAFAFALVCEQLNSRLPDIVEEFLAHAAFLRQRIEMATSDLIADIKNLLLDTKIQKLLGVDKDMLRSALHANFYGLRARDACEWIITDCKFNQWYNAPKPSTIVVFGQMGCGKTVLTAHVIDKLSAASKSKLPRPFLCYHYCENGESGRAVYIYSSLILQLVDQQKGFKVEFDKWYQRTKESEHFDPAQSSTHLEIFLSYCVEKLDREIFIVIDALDECDSESQHQLVVMPNGLLKKAQKLKVFFSSRPQKEIEDLLKGVIQLRWRPGLDRDTIIVKHMVDKQLRQLEPDVRSLVTKKVSKMAQGSAIWVRFTVELIQNRYMSSKIGPMKKFLAKTPPPVALSKLYAELFTHATGVDSTNRKDITVTLEILAVARRPLSILELGWALTLNDACADSQTVEDIEGSVDEGRVLRLLQPFLPQLDLTDMKKRQVRLVHSSLKELVLRSDPSGWVLPPNETEDLKTTKLRIEQRTSSIESSLLRMCVRYLLLNDLGQQTLISGLDELPILDSLDDLYDDSGKAVSSQSSQDHRPERETKEIYYDPAGRGFGEFYVYASCYWIEHFEASAPDSFPNISDIVRLCQANSKRLRNWIEQKCRPDCAIRPEFHYNWNSHDPLTILSLFGPEFALKSLLGDQTIDLKSEDFLSDSIEQTIWQIIRRGDLSRIPILFRDTRLGPLSRHIWTFNRLMIEWANSDKRSRPWEICFDLVFEICDDVLLREGWGNELFCLAAGSGCLPMLERLFKEAIRKPALRHELLRDRKRDQPPNSDSDKKRGINPQYRHQSIGEAVWNNRVEVFHWLLREEGIHAHLRHRDFGGQNVLHKAARSCNPEMMSLLVERFPEGVNESDEQGETPLNLVVFGAQSRPERLESAKILLLNGHADVRGGCTEPADRYFEPLRMAARGSDEAMCRTLVEFGGADPQRVLADISDLKEKLNPIILEFLSTLAGMKD